MENDLNRKTYDDGKTGYFARKNTTAEGLGVPEQFGVEGMQNEKILLCELKSNG